MKRDTPTIDVAPRERTGTRYAQRLRKEGRLPAIIYGHKTEPLSVSVDRDELLGHVGHGAHVLKLSVGGRNPEMCLVKDLQFGYLGDNVVHVDFARVNLSEEVTVQVHLAYVGTPEAGKMAGAILHHDHTELAVKCKVSEIPEELKVDLSLMDGNILTAGEVVLPSAVTLGEDASTPIASVSFVRAVEQVGEEAEVEATEAEPEVITESKADDGGKKAEPSE